MITKDKKNDIIVKIKINIHAEMSETLLQIQSEKPMHRINMSFPEKNDNAISSSKECRPLSSLQIKISHRKEIAAKLLPLDGIDSAIRSLEITQEGELKSIKYFDRVYDPEIARWAIQNDRCDVFDTLLNTLRPETHLLVLENDNYQSLEKWVAHTLESQDFREPQVFIKKCDFLKSFVSIGTSIAMKIKQSWEDLKNQPGVVPDTWLAFGEELDKIMQSLALSTSRQTFSLFNSPDIRDEGGKQVTKTVSFNI